MDAPSPEPLAPCRCLRAILAYEIREASRTCCSDIAPLAAYTTIEGGAEVLVVEAVVDLVPPDCPADVTRLWFRAPVRPR